MASSVTPEPGQVCTDSQTLAELSTMFPNVDCTVLVSVLQAHNGRLDTTVEYFMENSHSTDHVDHTVDIHDDTNAGQLLEDPSRDMIGHFSEDIGGLPEMLPNFIYNTEGAQSSSDEDSDFLQRSPTPDSDVDSEDDPLPTYEEACTDADRLPEAVYIQDEVQVVDDVVEMPREAHLEERTKDPVPVVREKTKKGTKHKKALKLAGKLKGKRLKVKIAKGKKSSVSSLSARPGYAPLCSDQEFEEETDST